MAQVKDIVDFTLGDLGLFDQGTRDKVMPAVRRAWYKVAAMHPWQFCRRTVDLAANNDTTQGRIMPSNMINVLGPIEDANENRYVQTHGAGTPYAGARYGFYFDDAHVPALIEEGDTLSIVEGATEFTWTGTWDADYIGEHIKFGNEPGFYAIDGDGSIAEKYWGPRISGGAVQIRPYPTMRLSLIDSAGARQDTAITVHYWVYPAPLYHDWQTFPEYLLDPMKWATLAETKGHTVDKKRGLAMRDYGPAFNAALNLAIVQNPSAPVVENRMDNRGQRMTFGRR